MTAEPHEELISAYLDGELSPEQRAEVEQRLSESSELRRLHAELLALRAGMQSLERHELDHDISGAVLRKAEQSVLRGADARPTGSTVRTRPVVPSGRSAGWRRVVWPAFAVAAALAILVYDASRRPEERQVARTLEQDEYAATPQSLGNAQEYESGGAAGSAVGREYERSAGDVELLDRDADGLPPQQPAMRARRSATASPESGLLEKVAEPRTARPAPEALKDALGMPMAQSKAAGGLELQCSPQFLHDRKFEKLLDEKKIKWRRVDANEAREKKAESFDAVDEVNRYRVAADQSRMTYQVTATPQQVDGILAELRLAVQPPSELHAYSNRNAAGSAAPADRQPSELTITLIASAKPTPPAEAEAAPPANASP